ncbi:MAG: ANL family adenylate-forming protein, partial [Angustibacter sp.]
HSLPVAAPARRPQLLVVTPVSHTTGTMVDAALLAGGEVRLHPGFDVEEVLTVLCTGEITDIYLAVPQLYELTERLANNPHQELPQLTQVLYSGTPAAPHRIRQAQRIFGPALMQLYGSTEAGGLTTLTPADHAEPQLLGTVGRPFDWVRIELRDHRGTPVERGGIGEVCARSDTTMLSYQDPRLPSPWWPDGWLRTGDLGRLDEFGYLTLVGRIGQVMKTRGVKIHPRAVEEQLLAHPLVRQAVVYVERDADLRESLHAAIEVPGAGPDTEPQFVRYLERQLTAAHVPRLTIMPTLPRTASGKIDLSRLRRPQS